MKIEEKQTQKSRNVKKNQIKKQKGITLVALVITVVIMLILAGVAIAAVVDGDGLFSKIREATEVYENAAESENDTIKSLMNEIDNYLGNSNSQKTDGSFDSTKGVNTPDTSALPKETTKYVTWNYNEADSLYEEQLSDNAPDNWYDYNNGQWANIKTTGNNLEAYWVWIPRFAYKLPQTTGNGDEKEIEVAFIKNNGTETVNGERAYYSTDTEITTDNSGLYVQATDFAKGTGENGEQAWIIHPAFTFGDDQLNGIWVAKYEASNPDCTTEVTTGEYNGADKQVEIKPNVTSWRGIQVANSFTACENMTKTGGVIGITSGNDNIIDTHMMKNMEWGAVASLSQSKYGVFNPQSATGVNGDKIYKIWNNSNSNYITGNAGTTMDSYNESLTNAYNSEIGVKASTTGTIYGIYDMAGGAYEQVMGVMLLDNSSTEILVGNNEERNSGFNGIFSDGTIFSNGIRNLPDSKYYDLYDFGTTFNDQEAYERGKIGDMTRELNPIDQIFWYNDRATFIYYREAFFYRGGGCSRGVDSGIFYFDGNSGKMSDMDSFRPVLLLF